MSESSHARNTGGPDSAHAASGGIRRGRQELRSVRKRTRVAARRQLEHTGSSCGTGTRPSRSGARLANRGSGRSAYHKNTWKRDGSYGNAEQMMETRKNERQHGTGWLEAPARSPARIGRPGCRPGRVTLAAHTGRMRDSLLTLAAHHLASSGMAQGPVAARENCPAWPGRGLSLEPRIVTRTDVLAYTGGHTGPLWARLPSTIGTCGDVSVPAANWRSCSWR